MSRWLCQLSYGPEDAEKSIVLQNLHKIEGPRGKPQGFFDRKEFCLILIRSLTPQQAAENALAIAVQDNYPLGQ
jgi:hypothetical protein